jgi:hypothetical protein
MTKIAELPDTNEFMTSNGEHVDLGYGYRQFTFAMLPVWNTDISYYSVTLKQNKYGLKPISELTYLSEKWKNEGFISKKRGINKRDIGYDVLTKDQFNFIMNKAGVAVQREVKLSFYDKYGGKLIVFSLFAILILLRILYER